MDYSESLNADYHNLGTKKQCCTRSKKCYGAVTLLVLALGAATVCLTVYLLGAWPKSAEDVSEAPFSDYQVCTKQDDCKELGYNYMCALNINVHESSGYCLAVDKCQKDEDCPPDRNLTCNTNPELELQGQGFCQERNLPSNATASPSGTTNIGDLDSLPDDYWTKLRQRLAVDPRHKISDGGSGIGQVTRPYKTKRKIFNFTAAGPCDIAPCDNPDIRDTYNDAGKQNVKLNFHVIRKSDAFHFPGNTDKDLENDITGTFATVKKNWAAAFNFEGQIHWYDSDLLEGAIAGDGPACSESEENMRYKSQRPFSVYKYETVLSDSKVFNSNKRKPVKLFAGDGVIVRVETVDDDQVQTCVVRCDSNDCSDYTEIKCFENTGTTSWTFTEKAYVQYAIKFKNRNSALSASLGALIHWRRGASCLASDAWKATVHDDWDTVSAYNVYIADFGPAAGLNGFGSFPWGDLESVGALFMGRHVINGEATTLAHEFGHDVGLMHTFTGNDEQRPSCGRCAEFSGQSNSHVGDFCEDTGPMLRAWDCHAPANKRDCINIEFGPTAPWDNIMSYGTCRSKLTPNQRARAKCYNDKMVSKLRP